MKFLVHYEGAGEGCDYTIGCNHALRLVEADGVAKAIKKVMTEIIGYGGEYDGPYDPESLSAVTVYTLAEIDAYSLDLGVIHTRRRQTEIEDQATAQETEDRATYEKLKARYG